MSILLEKLLRSYFKTTSSSFVLALSFFIYPISLFISKFNICNTVGLIIGLLSQRYGVPLVKCKFSKQMSTRFTLTRTFYDRNNRSLGNSHRNNKGDNYNTNNFLKTEFLK